MSSTVTKVGVREFRAHLPQYLFTSSTPLAITRHGETIGFYVPARHHLEGEELNALKYAAAQLEELLNAHHVTEDELLAEFRTLREEKKR